jgi:PucR family transcriptional regulator, purine catabolism regulatory protein
MVEGTGEAAPERLALPTVREVLALPELRHGKPEVVAGAAGLDRRVRWVHVSELADIATLLRGGELVLTTGIALPAADDALARYLDELAGAEVSGLVIELGRRFDAAPGALAGAAERHGLPLVALHREVRFVAVTEAVHSLIVNAQVAQLRLSDRVHQAFTALSLEGAPAAEILRRAAEMAGAPVVLENLAHQVLACEALGGGAGELLRDWEARSRRTPSGPRTGPSGPEGWLVTGVGARGEVWGRLLALVDGEPTNQQVTVLERAAGALALNRLVEREQESLERQAHRTLLMDLIGRGHAGDVEAHARARALGVPTERRSLTAVVVLLDPEPEAGGLRQQQRDHQAAEAVAAAVATTRRRALVAPLQPGQVGVLLATRPSRSRSSVLEALAGEVHRRLAALAPPRGAAVGAGATVGDLAEVRRSFLEAAQAAEAARGSGRRARAWYELADVRLRGLLSILRDDARLQAFVERELGPLLEHDQRHGGDLAAVLRAYLDHGRNKSAAADAFHLSRPAFYHRLATIERVLEVDLDSVESCLSLHVALLALDAVRDATGAPRPR